MLGPALLRLFPIRSLHPWVTLGRFTFLQFQFAIYFEVIVYIYQFKFDCLKILHLVQIYLHHHRFSK